ncbi:MAG TPA: LysM peptidoglycan-binding domain-containing M23 family metallopeptidase [Anaerolineales bacterium]
MNRFKLLSFSVLLVLLIFSACVRSYSSGPATQPNPNSNLIGTIVAQTLTAFPSAITQTATLPAQTPQDFISYYFDNINSRNYTFTWTLLSDRFQNNLNGSSQDGYQVYIDFWNSVNQVTVLDVTHTCQGDLCAVNVTMRLDYYNGQSDTSIYPYTLTYDHAGNTWLFDLLPNPTATPASMVTATAPSLLKRPEYNPGELVDYVAQTGDTLPALAAHFNTTSAEIRAANPQIPEDATTLLPGMPMKIPITYSPTWGTRLQIMPDSLFVDGPSVNGFDTGAFVSSQPGWLKDYREDIAGANRSAAELVDIVATNFSISPRTLLVLLEYQTGALSQPVPPSGEYPLGHVDENAAGLYRQLVYAGNILNAGYYGWRTGGLTQLVFPDYTIERPDPWQTAATVAFQYYYSLSSQASYTRATGPDGLRRVTLNLFGDPWAANVDLSHIPANLQQPALVLPFPAGYAWSFTGGPHSAWGAAALRPWAAIDFAPPVHGCDASYIPVVAMADGIVARSEAGVVMEDLDGDGNERTGWNILYLHIAADGEARLGQWLKRGDPLGFASCEGGIATGTHVHIARKYNGEWMPVDSVIPFNLEGWIAHTGDAVYQGTLTRGNQIVTASSYSNAASLIRAGQ